MPPSRRPAGRRAAGLRGGAIVERCDAQLELRCSRLCLPQRFARLRNGRLRLLEPDRQLVQREDNVDVTAEDRRQSEHLVHVPLGVVVGEDGARDVRCPAGCGEIARGREDGVLGIPRIGEPVAVSVGAPAQPGVGHELHPADCTGQARPHVAAEVRLDLVDRGEHLPGNPVGGAGTEPERLQLLVRALLRRPERRLERVARHEYRAFWVRDVGARQDRRRWRDDLEGVRVGASVETTSKMSAVVVGSEGTTAKMSAEAVPAVRTGASARVSAAVASARLMPPPVG